MHSTVTEGKKGSKFISMIEDNMYMVRRGVRYEHHWSWELDDMSCVTQGMIVELQCVGRKWGEEDDRSTNSGTRKE